MGCVAQARRYFEQALDNDRGAGKYMMQRFAMLYELERNIRENNISGENIANLRKEKAVPILEDMQRFMKEKTTSVLPKSPIGKAIAYALPRWKKLSLYTQHSELYIDNNLVENQIRSLALDRKKLFVCRQS